MKQHGDEHWSGHREITREAVRRLFATSAGPDGRIRGIDEEQYFEELDQAQAHQDRPLGAGIVHHFAGTDLSVPYVGPGPTMHSAWANPDVQREHFMADPYKSGTENLEINAGYLTDELAAARRAGGAELTEDVLEAEMPHLGAAVHALQDSYSGAHAWREDVVYTGDLLAPLQSFHVFTPGHAIGVEDGRNTHADEFDEPPAESGSTRAAVEATFRVLQTHEQSYGTSPDQAEVAMRQTLGPMVGASPSGVTVNTEPNPQWEAERDRRLGIEQQSATAAKEPEPEELRRLGDVLSMQAGNPLTATPAATGDGAAPRATSHRQRQQVPVERSGPDSSPPS